MDNTLFILIANHIIFMIEITCCLLIMKGQIGLLTKELSYEQRKKRTKERNKKT